MTAVIQGIVVNEEIKVIPVISPCFHASLGIGRPDHVDMVNILLSDTVFLVWFRGEFAQVVLTRTVASAEVDARQVDDLILHRYILVTY